MRIPILLVLLILLSGCAKKVPLGNVYNTNTNLSYNDLKKIFTEKGRLEWDGGNTDFYATILHKSMMKFRGDIPDIGTGIEFSSRLPITIWRYLITVKINNKTEYLISGIGTDSFVVNGAKNSSVVYKPLTLNKDTPQVYSFILYFPFNINIDTKTISITGEHMDESKTRFEARWEFTSEGTL